MRIVRLSSISGPLLRIDADTFVADDVSGGEFEIAVSTGARLVYAYAETGENEAQRLVRLAGVWAAATVRGVLIAADGRIKRRIETRLEADDTAADVALLSLARDGGEVDLDGVLAIPEGVKRAEWSLSEDNIFLGGSGKIRGLPTLIVHSDEVRASHAMRVERISDERMFYLRSRGLGERESLDTLVGASVRGNLEPVRAAAPAVYDEFLTSLGFPVTE